MAASSVALRMSCTLYQIRNKYLRNCCIRTVLKSDHLAERSRNYFTDACRSSNGDAVSKPVSTDLQSSAFELMLHEKRLRSRNSVLVHVHSKVVVPQLQAHCQTCGTVRRASHYTIEKDKDFVLIEFENENSVLELLRSTNHFSNPHVIPVHSRYLWYREKSKGDTSEARLVNTSNPIHHESPPNHERLLKRIQNAKSVSEQMVIHHETMRLTDLGQQLRFFVCHQLESAFTSLFSECVVLPFGSSVNGFGSFNGDLDMVLCFGQPIKTVTDDGDSHLFFHTKRSSADGRVKTQRYLDIFGDIISSFFPGCSFVQRILHARIPIVKFHQELVNLDCDLSMTNLSGVYMSELLHLYGESDARVRPLVSVVLRWAKVSGLTHDTPGRWITNFTLILMVAAFLQCRSLPILPSLGELQQLAGPSDRRISEDIDCTFLRDLDKFPKLQNNEDLGDLLLEFFSFYASFNFKSRGLSLVAGQDVRKPDSSPLYVQNPLEIEMNVSKNVSQDEMTRFSDHLKTALFTLETSSARTRSVDEPWGLSKLFSIGGEGRGKRVIKGKWFEIGDLLNGDDSAAVAGESDAFISARLGASKANFDATSAWIARSSSRDVVQVLPSKDIVGKLGLKNLMQNKLNKTTSNKRVSKRRSASKMKPWTF